MFTNIKTFEDACKVLNISTDLPAGENIRFASSVNSHYQLMIIAAAVNGDWKPNWEDSNQEKYYPWFRMYNGVSFNYSYYHCRISRVSSRLCFQTQEMADYVGQQFEHLYKQYFLITE